mgnify:CR=1 FL=1
MALHDQQKNIAFKFPRVKNALVADIDADGIIYKSIMEYVQLLNEKSADITLPLASVCSCKVTARVKAQNSIWEKESKEGGIIND